MVFGVTDMKILAVDSSSAPASVAVVDNGTIIGEFTININKTHSEKLLPMIDVLLDTVGLKASDMDAFAISRGPGSFTGLRIGMSAVKLMAEVSQKPLIAVDTLEALAKNCALDDCIICPMIDARNNTVFTAIYELKKGVLTEIMPADALKVADITGKLTEFSENVIICGEYAKYKKLIDETADGKKDFIFAPHHMSMQRAGVVGLIALEKYEEGIRTLPAEIVPFYVRESQAEQSKRAKEQKNG